MGKNDDFRPTFVYLSDVNKIERVCNTHDSTRTIIPA